MYIGGFLRKNIKKAEKFLKNKYSMKAKAEVMHSAFFLYLEVIPGKEKRGRSTPRWYIQVLQKVKLPVTGFSYALLLFVDNSSYAS